MAKPALRVSCRGGKRTSFLHALAAQLEGVGRDADEAIQRVLTGEGTEADLATIKKAERVAAFVTGAA